MATLALSTAGAALGGSFLPSVGVFGATLSGAAIGRAAGAIAGRAIDQALFSPSGQDRVVEGPRLSDLHLLTSGEGGPVPRLFGRARLGGQIIWGPPFEEQVVTSQTGDASGGKSSSQSSGGATRRDYRYFASFAIALCEGPITRIGRVWADGQEIDFSQYVFRLYTGTETQTPDALIVGHEGVDRTPAYAGIAYIVVERMPLSRFGNRVPQLSFEVFRALDGLEDRVHAVTIIPGAGEFAYDTAEIIRRANKSESFPANTHTQLGGTDWQVSLDQLQATAPNLKNAGLVVSWFGTDLRVGACDVRPGVDRRDKETVPHAWSVQGISRAEAYEVSRTDGRPAYGGTPADRSVVAALQDLNARGVKATFYPFLLMDIPAGNSRPDPYGNGSQAAYPWRGRITVAPAPGRDGSPDGTPAVGVDVDRFVGSAAISDFQIVGTQVRYTGPAEWSWRRMVLHYAHLAKAAGGIDAFLIGSELRGLTWLRDETENYPFVDALVTLARDVKAVLGPQTKVSYAADWSEYFGHQPGDGTGDVTFHLDPLWASADVDAVAIDCYWPLADWRDGDAHLDRVSGAPSIYDPQYLIGNIRGGEGYDWYYASPEARAAQERTPITDGAGKPWVYRYKDVLSWWREPHINRRGGTEVGQPTAWVPQSKPIWFSEVGCPAVDKGANQPNVFIDPKSIESSVPYFSSRQRDDLMQRRYLDALLGFYDETSPGFQEENNPVSPLYGGRMVDVERMYLYTWDARPHPVFPAARSIWSDGANWETGHWLTGRLGGLDLARLVAALCELYGFDAYDTRRLEGVLHGLVIDRLMSARQALQPLELAFSFDAVESGASIRFAHRGEGEILRAVVPETCVAGDSADAPVIQLTRDEEGTLPSAVKLSFVDGNADYARAAVESRQLDTVSRRVSSAELPIVLGVAEARGIAERWLHETWAARTRASFSLPPSALALEPGDLLSVPVGGLPQPFRITGVTDGAAREIEARTVLPTTPAQVSIADEQDEPDIPTVGPVRGVFLDLPGAIGLPGSDGGGWFAASANPWPGAVMLMRSDGADSRTLVETITRPSTIGRTGAAAGGRPTWRFDRGMRLTVTLESGALAGRSMEAVLEGENLAAIDHGGGEFEIIQFMDAELIGSGEYALGRMLRGQGGTEHLADRPIPEGALFVLLDDTVRPLGLTLDALDRPLTWHWGPAQRGYDHFSWAQDVFNYRGMDLRPRAPVHLRKE
ncbi:MAG: glycoside hydrolase/phage tail family protein, partial [Pseudomonadota bacterium]